MIDQQSDHWLRRDLLRVGSLALAGIGLPTLLRAEVTQRSAARRKSAKSCIVFFLDGGPSHIDLWDMKPEAPSNVRGKFSSIATPVPGMQVCEHLPLLAQQMKHVAIVRSVHHKVVDHNAGAYYCLTGKSPVLGGRLIVRPEPNNFPTFGAVCGKLLPTENVLPSFVHLSELMANNGSELPGQRAGFLGPGFDPLVIGDCSVPEFKMAALEMPERVSLLRMHRRFEMLNGLRGATSLPGEMPKVLRNFQSRALDLLTSEHAKAAFDLAKEPLRVRARYGLPDRTDRVEARKFGGLPHLGQCMLMARRLIESGVRLVTVGSGRRLCQAWDTHRDHFGLLEKSLLPYTERAFSALLEDMSASGLLDETLVVAMGEFGRTPRLGQITSGAGADAEGRDHWPHCYSVLFAGAGIQGGAIYGSSDGQGAFPADLPVTPDDIAATIYYALGIDPATEIHDLFRRPIPLASGTPLTALFT